MDVAHNLIMKSYKSAAFKRWIFQDRRAGHANAQDKIEQFAIKAGPEGTPIRYLSGGNIQKVIIARELSERPAVLVALYPTRGLDIGKPPDVHREYQIGRAVGAFAFQFFQHANATGAYSEEIRATRLSPQCTMRAQHSTNRTGVARQEVTDL